MPRSRGTVGWSGCSCANCNKRKNVGLRSEDIDLLAEDLADLLDQGDFRYEDHPEVEPGTPSWIFDANTAAARTLVAAVSAGDAERLGSAWRELELEDNIDDFYRCEAAGQLLILAAQLGKASVLKPLLALGASLDAVDEHGHQGPALLHAASAGNVNVVRALLEAGASPDQQDVRGQSALIVAVLADRAAVAEVLLSAGADPNRADSFGATPIWYCGQFNALDCIPVLGLHGADAFHVDPQTQDDPVEAALKQGYTRAGEALRRLQQRQRMRERQKGPGGGGAAAQQPSSEQELKERQQQADAAMAALLAELEASSVSRGNKQGGGKGKKKAGKQQQRGEASAAQQQQQQAQQQVQQHRGDWQQHGDQQQQPPQQQQQLEPRQPRQRVHRQQQLAARSSSPSPLPSPSSSGPLASLIAVLHPQSEAVVLSATEAARRTAVPAGGGGAKARPHRSGSANGRHEPPPAATAVVQQQEVAVEEAAAPPEKEDPNAELRRQWEALLAEAATCGSDAETQQRLATLIEAQMPGVAEAGVSVKYGKKLLGKLQRAPVAAEALAAAAADATTVLAPGFEEALAEAEAAERRANPAAALPDDLFSDEPPPAARQPSAAERRAAEAEGALEAAVAEARSLRAFLQEASLEAAEATLAALQQRRQHREQQVAAAAAAVQLASAAAAAQQQLPASLSPLLPANGHLAQLPLMQQQAAGVAAPAAAHRGLTTHHDGLSPDNECVICMADVRRVLCVPCGHMCCCASCIPLAQADGKCPLCRAPLQDLVQLY